MSNDEELKKELYTLTGINFNIKRTARRTAAVYFSKNKPPEIRCGRKFPHRYIREFILNNEKSIKENLKSLNAITTKFKYEIGGKLLFLGEEYNIVCGADFAFDTERHLLFVPQDGDPKKISAFFEKKCRETLVDIIILDRLMYFSELMSLCPSKASIGRAKGYWGICSAQRITFSFYLAMADRDTIDYVIVHELAHLKHKNHGEQFWKEVEKYMPDYKERRAKLKNYAKAII